MATYPIIFSGQKPLEWASKRKEIVTIMRQENCQDCITSNTGSNFRMADVVAPVDVEIVGTELVYQGIWDEVRLADGRVAMDPQGNILRAQRRYPVTYSNVEELRTAYTNVHEAYGKDFNRYISVIKYNTDAKNGWEIKKAKALKIMRESIGIQVRAKVMKEIDVGDVKSIFVKLDSIYWSDDVDNTALIIQLTTLRIGAKEEIATFANRIDTIVDQVDFRVEQEAKSAGEAGYKMSSSHKLSYLTNGINNNHERARELQHMMDISRADKKNYDQTVEYLISEESRLLSIVKEPNYSNNNNRQYNNHRINSTDVQWRGSPANNKGSGRSVQGNATDNKGPCSKCGGEQHAAKYCKNTVKCGRCNKDGHVTNLCRSKVGRETVAYTECIEIELKDNGSDNIVKGSDSDLAPTQVIHEDANINWVDSAKHNQVGPRSSHDNRLILLDTGATTHITPMMEYLTDVRSVSAVITGFNGADTHISVIGRFGRFGDAYHSPSARNSLLSMSKLVLDGIKITLSKDGRVFTASDSKGLIAEFVLVNSSGSGVYAIVRGPNEYQHMINQVTGIERFEINALTRLQQANIKSRKEMLDATIREMNKGDNQSDEIELEVDQGSDNELIVPTVSDIRSDLEVTNHDHDKELDKNKKNISTEANIRIRQLHCSLGHPSDQVLANLLNSNGILGCPYKGDDVYRCSRDLGQCNACIIGKMTAKRAGQSRSKQAEFIGEVIHIDIMQFESDIYLIFVEDLSGYINLNLLESKHSDVIVNHINKVVREYRQLGHRVNEYITIRSDNEPCLISKYVEEQKDVMVRLEQIEPGRHEKVAERYIRTVKDKARALIYGSQYKVPDKYHKYAVKWAAQSMNLVTNSKSGNQTPDELVSGVKQDYRPDGYLTYGDVEYFRVSYPEGTVGPRAELGLVLAKILYSKGVQLYSVLLLDGHSSRLVRRGDFKRTAHTTNIEKLVSMIDNIGDDDMDELDHENSNKFEAHVAEKLSAEFDDTTKYFEGYNLSVKKGLEMLGVKAEDAIAAELQQMVTRNVWRPVMYKDIVPGYQELIHESLMFLKEKTDKVKARLCADPTRYYRPKELKAKVYTSYKQRDNIVKEVDVGDVYAPTCNTVTLFTTLGLSSLKGMKYRMSKDVVGAFLLAVLLRLVYMRITKEVADILVKYYPEYKQFQLEDGSIIVQLIMALYGLPESPLRWNEHLDNNMKLLGFKQSENDKCLYFIERNGDQMYITIFVDDLYIMASSSELLEWFHNEFTHMYPDHTTHRENEIEYLGMMIRYDDKSQKIHINQHKYIEKILDKYKINELKDSKYPSRLDLFSKPVVDVGVDRILFLSMVMSLMYLAKRGRPDILKDVTFLASKSSNPTTVDYDNVIRIFRYIKYSRNRQLVLGATELEVVMFVDASFLSHSDLKGHSGCVITLGLDGGIMATLSRKQKILTRSSTESELVAIDDSYKYAVYCAGILSELSGQMVNIRILEDNKSTIKLIMNGESNNINTKHIKLKYYFIKIEINEGRATVEYWWTKNMLGDLMTKPLVGDDFDYLTNKVLGDKGVIKWRTDHDTVPEKANKEGRVESNAITSRAKQS